MAIKKLHYEKAKHQQIFYFAYLLFTRNFLLQNIVHSMRWRIQILFLFRVNAFKMILFCMFK